MDKEAVIRSYINPDDRDREVVYQTIDLQEQLIIHVVTEDSRLYYLWLIARSNDLSQMKELARIGEEECLARSLNHFELVLVSESPESIEFEAKRIAKELENLQPLTQIRVVASGTGE